MLAEAVIALLVTVMTLGILQQSLQIVKKVESNTRSEVLRWHVSNERIQDLFLYAKVLNSTEQKIVFEVSEDKRYSIESYKNGDMLRMTGAESGGHMPILVNLKHIKFEQKESIYIIHTIDKFDRKSEMYLINEGT
ncbi:ComGF family competence protein [Companilactobacillus jidongensis]|uniref:ComGF family competence protein n=1 Tax=Companilactobacillus jidongensis TaxID=2486006 RepID=UPI0013DDC64C|nr:ComGF family competence protein [Companilactobacillus jidongensis]